MTLGKELRQRYELAHEYVSDDGYPYTFEGEQRVVLAADFAQDINIVPVSDPNIFSTSQRLAIAQVGYEMAVNNPDVVNKREAIKRVFEAAKVPDPDALMIPEVAPLPYDPVGEIQAILNGKPVLVTPEQPHVSYLHHHMAFLQNPGYGGNEEVIKAVGPALQAVVGQHLAFAWLSAVRQAGVPAGALDPKSGQIQQPPAPPETIAQMVMAISPMLAQVPGLPAVDKPTEPDKAAEQQQKLAHNQALHEQKMRHDAETHDQKMQKDAETTAQDLAQSGVEHQQEMQAQIENTMLTQKERELDLQHKQAQAGMDMAQRQQEAELSMQTTQQAAQLDQQVAQTNAQMNIQERQADLQHNQQAHHMDLQHQNQSQGMEMQHKQQSHGQDMQQRQQASHMDMADRQAKSSHEQTMMKHKQKAAAAPKKPAPKK
jgi:hypothetical protein